MTPADDSADRYALTTLASVVGHLIEIHDVRWEQFQLAKGPIPMAVVYARDLELDRKVFFPTTAIHLVAVLLHRQAQLDGFPYVARITHRSDSTGRRRLKLIKPKRKGSNGNR